MWRSSGKKQKGLEMPERVPSSHNLSRDCREQTASTQPARDAAESQQPSILVTPATPRPGNTSQAPPSPSGSDRTLTADSPVVMVSPYRISKEDRFPPVPFSKVLLIQMDHNKHHLEIDLLRPEGETKIFPPQDLSPLCLYRKLRTLKITGMMQSYQWYIWLVVWLNPQLTDLTLEMAGEAELLDMKAIAETQKYGKCKPTMREVVQGKTTTEILEQFHIVNLTLTNFVVNDPPFRWFSESTLQKVELHRCKDAGFQLPTIMDRGFNITLTV